MSKVLTSIGVEFYIGWSDSYNEPPLKTQYKKIPQVIENSDTNLEPETISTKSYNNFRYTTYTEFDIDTGGVQFLKVNCTKDEDAESIWNEMAEKCEDGKYIWLCIFVPQMQKSTYIPINPIKVDGYNMPLNDRITTKLYYTIVGNFELRETIKPFWTNNAWNYLPFFNGGNKLTSESEIDVDDINMLFNNVFYLKGT